MADSSSVSCGTPGKKRASLLGIRKSIGSLTSEEITALRSGVTKMLAIRDDRGYEHWAGIHGLPLPISCTHGSPLFLPWHRAYLYFFEQYLMDFEATVRIPWWDWADNQAIPYVYDQPKLPDGTDNPLASAPIRGIPDNQFAAEGTPPVAETYRQPDQEGSLPTAADVAAVLALDDFSDFTSQVEQLHNQVHVWVGGTMGLIPIAAFDPIFWSHHAMIDRLWALWQQKHPGAGAGVVPLDNPLAPFPTLNVGKTLDIGKLGYTYAAAASSAVP